ncbi:hypothetical protein BCR35DRAFT_328142 [Leucosporidium creatinivorum]|uniref:Uncharacterized protein n=1 Tax=Leucosporidium creatinivorum TaxID=106004 RepID=A0A1Y2G2C6_9BASI|nr:hypothetical protein BCR35DRAFT_328142 [Leucosporidium creatinivorum]
MLARTFTLALIASLAATGFAWDRDGEDIRFAQIKKIDDDKFKKTKFNIHDAAVHNKNFNQVENKDKDVLNAVAFRKNDDGDFKDDDDKGHGRKFRHHKDDDDFKHRRPFHNKKGDAFKHRPFKGKGHGRKGGKGDW